jgi:hypothetical protein
MWPGLVTGADVMDDDMFKVRQSQEGAGNLGY